MRSSLLVGLMLIGVTGTLSWSMMATNKNKFEPDNTTLYRADFSDAAGLRWKTRVQINGIDVGKIDSIRHGRNPAGRFIAKVGIRLLKEYPLYANAKLRKMSESLLGDFRLDLDPGAPQTWCVASDECQAEFNCQEARCLKSCSSNGDCPTSMQCDAQLCSYPILDAGGAIGQVQSASDIDEIQAELKEVARNVNEVTKSFSRVLAGPEGEGSLKTILARVEESMDAIAKATAALSGNMVRNEDSIDRIIGNLDRFTGALAHSTGKNGDLQRTAGNISRLSEKLEKLADNLNDMVTGNMDDEETSSLQGSMSSLNASLDNVSDISRKINDGSGTIGQLINNPSIANKLEATLKETEALVGGLSRMKTEIELRSQYETPFIRQPNDTAELRGAIKNTLAIRLVPKPDKYYIIEAVADARGRQLRTTTTTITTDKNNNEVSNETVNQTINTFDDLKYSAQFAKRYYWLTMRFGITENTGGFGFNLHGLEDTLELRLDLFDFTRRRLGNLNERAPRVRAAGMWEFSSHLHVQAGFDDPFNADLATWFVGGALRFTDEDLRTIMMVAPSPTK